MYHGCKLVGSFNQSLQDEQFKTPGMTSNALPGTCLSEMKVCSHTHLHMNGHRSTFHNSQRGNNPNSHHLITR